MAAANALQDKSWNHCAQRLSVCLTQFMSIYNYLHQSATTYVIYKNLHHLFGTKCLVPSTWYRIVGAAYFCQGLGAKYLVASHILGTKCLVPKQRGIVPSTWYHVPSA